MTFGGGTTTHDQQLAQFSQTGVPMRIQDYQNNIGLGLTVTPNTTLFIQYRIGGGTASNIGVNAINQLGTVNFSVNGPSDNINQTVSNSLTVNNVTAAIGGANQPTTEEVRNMVGFNFSSQKRAVTVNDYQTLIATMPGKFGAPAKVGITENNNKIVVQMLAYDADGQLTEILSNTLKNNVATYLSNYRMINDYVEITSAQVVDLAFDLSVVFESTQNQGQVITEIVNQLSQYMSSTTREMGQNLNVSEVRRIVQDVSGVIALSDISIFNRTGGEYSSSQTSQRYSNSATKQIEIIDDTIFAEPNQIYQVRFPNKDITVRVKDLKGVSFS